MLNQNVLWLLFIPIVLSKSQMEFDYLVSHGNLADFKGAYMTLQDTKFNYVKARPFLTPRKTSRTTQP